MPGVAIESSVGAVNVYPVRHHSPRASAAVRAFLDSADPEVVLIEGPADASELIDVLVDPETKPPVAILGYRTDGPPASALWPFADYSPEYTAACWAHENKRRVEFVDIPVGVALAVTDDSAEGDPGSAEGDPGAAEGDPGSAGAPAGGASEPPQPSPAPASELPLSVRVALERGFRSFEEFWEAMFEAPAYDPDSFRDALLAWAEVVRLEEVRPVDRARNAVMAGHVARVVAAGTRPEKIALVVGAAHAAAMVAGDVDPAATATLPAAVPSACTLVPYSFPRLAAQLGYGAGNRAPFYYQRAHEAGTDYRRATLETLVEFTNHLRLRGYAVSLADTIEAYRLAVTLANLRSKTEPGLDEVREAAIATLTRGDAVPVNTFLWSTVVGHAVGQVASRIGRNSLQEEFWREVNERRLPRTDEPERLILHLNNDLEIGTSVFLHRLRIGAIPYASLEATRTPSGAAVATGADALSRPRETWEAQWTPATDAALVEAIVRGSTLEDVAADALDTALGGAVNAGAAAQIALEAVVASCSRTAGQALDACERLAADDLDLPSLAAAARALSGLASYGSSRAQSSFGDAAIAPLLTKIFSRAVLRVADACTGTDDAVAPAHDALRTLQEVALSQPMVDRGAWIAAARGLVSSYVVNAGAAGLATGLLYLANEIGDEELALVVGQRLSNTMDPIAAATFLTGFLEVNAIALVRSRAVVAALDAYLTGLDVDRFRETLPILRRAFSELGPTERRYLAENLIALRGIGAAAADAQAVLRQGDAEALKAMSEDLAKVMDDLGDLL